MILVSPFFHQDVIVNPHTHTWECWTAALKCKWYSIKSRVQKVSYCKKFWQCLLSPALIHLNVGSGTGRDVWPSSEQNIAKLDYTLANLNITLSPISSFSWDLWSVSKMLRRWLDTKIQSWMCWYLGHEAIHFTQQPHCFTIVFLGPRGCLALLCCSATKELTQIILFRNLGCWETGVTRAEPEEEWEVRMIGLISTGIIISNFNKPLHMLLVSSMTYTALWM